ncbi:MAG: class I SAM-dependent methyltransferase [Proteobacteria bacterium]|nr:class I SAM-dependent methyltransferase [Pseudomonadota bacterium]
MSSAQTPAHFIEPQEKVPCLMCGATENKAILQVSDHLFAQPGKYQIVQCCCCELVYVNPRPTLEALKKHYPDNYFAYTQLEEISRPMQYIFNPGIKSNAIRRIRGIERVIGQLPQETKVVDVGCGLNLFLRYLGELRGCQGVGVDFNARVTEYVRKKFNMPVVHGTLHDAGFANGQFDLVTMHEYLEHEPNPLQILTEARRITRTGGHINIEVPYIGGIPARIFRSRWSQFDVPRHLVFFTPQTLEKMLKRCGYQLVAVRTFGLPFIIGLSVLHSLGFNKLGGIKGAGWLFVGVAGTPFLPFVPIMHEFMSIVARAE